MFTLCAMKTIRGLLCYRPRMCIRGLVGSPSPALLISERAVYTVASLWLRVAG